MHIFPRKLVSMRTLLKITSSVTVIGLVIYGVFTTAIGQTAAPPVPLWYHVMALLGFELMTAGITGSIAVGVTRNSVLPTGGSVGVLQRFGPFYLFMLGLFAIVNMWGLGFFATSVPNNTHALYYAEPLGINALLEASIWLFLGGAVFGMFQLVRGLIWERRNLRSS